MGGNTLEEEQKEPIWEDVDRYQELFLGVASLVVTPSREPFLLVVTPPKRGGRKEGESERLRGGVSTGHWEVTKEESVASAEAKENLLRNGGSDWLFNVRPLTSP